MKNIALSNGEIEAIKKYLNGEVEIWTEDEEIKENLTSVIDKANEILDELPADYDFGDDMIKWFYDQYNKQNA